MVAIRSGFLICLFALAPLAFAQTDGLVMLPDTVDFDNVPVGGNYFGKFVYFENATGDPIGINSPYIGGQDGNPFAWFSNLIGPFTFGDGASLSYGIRFRPPWPGPFEDDFCVPVEGYSNPCVHLRGRGVEALEVPVFQGETTSAVVHLPNPGYRTLDVRIRSGEPWLTPLPSFALLAPGDSLAVTLAFNAASLETGTYRDTLRVEAVGIYFDYVLPITLVVGNEVVGEEDAEAVRLDVGAPYPNPTQGSVRLPFVLGGEAAVSVDVVDLRGRTVHTEGPTLYSPGRHALAVDGEGLAVGVYVLYIRVRRSGDAAVRTATHRLVVVD